MMFLEQDSGKEQCTLVYHLHLYACTTSTYPRLNMFNNINTCICTGNIVHKGADNSPHTLVFSSYRSFNISNFDQIVKVWNIKLHRFEDKKIRAWEKSLFPCVHSTPYRLECTANIQCTVHILLSTVYIYSIKLRTLLLVLTKI